MSSLPACRHELRLDLPAERSSVPAVRHTVDALLRDLGVGPDRARIALAVSEACSNVVLHAYREAGSRRPAVGSLSIVVRLTASGVRVTVADDGPGIEPRGDSPGAGFGLLVIGELTDELSIGRDGERTVVEMGFARAAGAGAGPSRTVARAV